MAKKASRDRVKRGVIAVAALAVAAWLVLLIRSLVFGTGS
jgi:hypothetical protein